MRPNLRPIKFNLLCDPARLPRDSHGTKTERTQDPQGRRLHVCMHFAVHGPTRYWPRLVTQPAGAARPSGTPNKGACCTPRQQQRQLQYCRKLPLLHACHQYVCATCQPPDLPTDTKPPAEVSNPMVKHLPVNLPCTVNATQAILPTEPHPLLLLLLLLLLLHDGSCCAAPSLLLLPLPLLLLLLATTCSRRFMPRPRCCGTQCVLHRRPRPRCCCRRPR
jgi:hypothetical protein